MENLHPVKRQKLKQVSDIILGKGVPIIDYIPNNESGLSNVYFKPLLQLQTPYVFPSDIVFDIMWHSSYFFNKEHRPNWSGYMTDVSVGEYPG